MSIRNLKTFNDWFKQFGTTIDVAVLREGAVPSPGTLRSKIKCKNKLTAALVNNENVFQQAVSSAQTVSRLKFVLSRFVVVGGMEVGKRDFLVLSNQCVLHGARNWKARGQASLISPLPKAPKSWVGATISIGQHRWVISHQDGQEYPAVVTDVHSDFVKVEYVGIYHSQTEDLTFANIGKMISDKRVF